MKAPQAVAFIRLPCPSKEGTGRCTHMLRWVVLLRSPQIAASQMEAVNLVHTCHTYH